MAQQSPGCLLLLPGDKPTLQSVTPPPPVLPRSLLTQTDTHLHLEVFPLCSMSMIYWRLHWIRVSGTCWCFLSSLYQTNTVFLTSTVEYAAGSPVFPISFQNPQIFNKLLLGCFNQALSHSLWLKWSADVVICTTTHLEGIAELMTTLLHQWHLKPHILAYCKQILYFFSFFHFFFSLWFLDFRILVWGTQQCDLRKILSLYIHSCATYIWYQIDSTFYFRASGEKAS